MKQLNIYLAALFLVASLAFSNPSVAHADVRIDSSGAIVLNCQLGWAAKAVWYMNGPGYLGSIWFYRSTTGQSSPLPRSFSFPIKSYVYATMPARSGYKLERMTWDSNQSGYLWTAYCVIAT